MNPAASLRSSSPLGFIAKPLIAIGVLLLAIASLAWQIDIGYELWWPVQALTTIGFAVAVLALVVSVVSLFTRKLSTDVSLLVLAGWAVALTYIQGFYYAVFKPIDEERIGSEETLGAIDNMNGILLITKDWGNPDDSLVEFIFLDQGDASALWFTYLGQIGAVLAGLGALALVVAIGLSLGRNAFNWRRNTANGMTGRGLLIAGALLSGATMIGLLAQDRGEHLTTIAVVGLLSCLVAIGLAGVSFVRTSALSDVVVAGAAAWLAALSGPDVLGLSRWIFTAKFDQSPTNFWSQQWVGIIGALSFIVLIAASIVLLLAAVRGLKSLADAGSTGYAAAGPGLQTAAQPVVTQTPAGWYPDPSGSGRQRYWDGQQWTGHVAD